MASSCLIGICSCILGNEGSELDSWILRRGPAARLCGEWPTNGRFQALQGRPSAHCNPSNVWSLAGAFSFSPIASAIKLKTVLWGLGLQLLLCGFFVLRFRIGRNQAFRNRRLLRQSAAQLCVRPYSQVVFGDLGLPEELSLLVSPLPQNTFFWFSGIAHNYFHRRLFCAALYHIGVMQIIIRAAAWLMTLIMGAQQRQSLSTVAASIFVGQTEAPLTIRPFTPTLTKSEVVIVMTSGMAHISGRIDGQDTSQVNGADPKKLLAAVIMTAPDAS